MTGDLTGYFPEYEKEAQNEYNLRCYWISLRDNGLGPARARRNVDLAGAAGLWLLYSDYSNGLGAVKFPQKRGLGKLAWIMET